MVTSWDIWVNVRGGGTTGQAGAVKMGLARAIVKAVPELEQDLRKKGLLTRDARMVERKKYGQPGARKRFQFSKRYSPRFQDQSEAPAPDRCRGLF